MLRLIPIVLSALIFGYFASENAHRVDITIASVRYEHTPLYLIVGISMLTGVVLSWFLSIVYHIGISTRMRGKEKKLNQTQKTVNELTRRIHELELENVKLKTETDNDEDDGKAM